MKKQQRKEGGRQNKTAQSLVLKGAWKKDCFVKGHFVDRR